MSTQYIYGCAEDYIANMEADNLSSDDAAQMLFHRIHNFDAIYVTSLVFAALTTVQNPSSHATETFSAFEARLSA